MRVFPYFQSKFTACLKDWMIMWVPFFILVICSSNLLQEARCQTENCRTPSNEVGNCINLRQCPTLLALLQQISQLPNAVQLLQDSNCGYDGRMPKVCCPLPPGTLPEEESSQPEAPNMPQPGNPNLPTRPDLPETSRPEEGSFNISGVETGNPDTPERPEFGNKPPGGSDQGGSSPDSGAPEGSEGGESPDDPDTPERPEFGNKPPGGSDQGGSSPDSGAPEGSEGGESPDGSGLETTSLPLSECGRYNPVSSASPQPTDFPWLALLQYASPDGRTGYRCIGTVITNRHVLTAAHCVVGLPGGWNLLGVRLGEFNLQESQDCSTCNPPLEVTVGTIIPHPGYLKSSKNQRNDIALLKLNWAVNFTDQIRPICLLQDEGKSYVGSDLNVTGWGAMNGSAFNNLQRRVVVKVISERLCSDTYTNVDITSSQLCAQGSQEDAPCLGDGGGPLSSLEEVDGALRHVQVGVVSFGPRVCGSTPDIFTKIGYYYDWIVSELQS